jgi:hypothetical protein
MDDIIIAMENNDWLHKAKVQHFLQKLQKHNLFLKPEKCHFHQVEVDYLGVIIGQGLVWMDPIKVQGIIDWPASASVKDVHSFLGFCNFYWVFIPEFSKIARPFNDLTKKGWPWSWSSIKQNAFQQLKMPMQAT